MRKLSVILLVIALSCTLATCSKTAPISSDPVPTAVETASATPVPTPKPEKTVSFADPILEKMVRAAMNKPEGDITVAEAEALTELKISIDWNPDPVPNTQIKDISGLENFKNLENLELHFHAISDISPLAGLTKLTRLSLGGNPISDLTPLAGLTNIESLTLFNCQAKDYTPLAKLTRLGMLLLDYSTLDDVSILSGLTELWWLSIANTQVNDVSPLSNLSNLRQLQLSGCPISDYTPLLAIYPNLEDKDFNIVTSLRQLGFAPINNAPQVEGYKEDDMFITVHHAEWGEMDDEERVDAVLLCKDYETENEIIVIYYPLKEQFLVLSHPGDFRYFIDVKSLEAGVEYGEDRANAFIEKAYDEVDPFVLVTPIRDFERIMTETFGVSADMLFDLPREAEAVQPAASENSLIGMGFDFNDAGTFGVYEEHEPHYVNVAITRPEWGECSESWGWNVQFMDTNINGYSVLIWYFVDQEKYNVRIERDGQGGNYDYFPATDEYSNIGPDAEIAAQMFNNAFETKGDGFRDKPITYMEKVILDRFGMSIDELYAAPKQ
ncbi:MAG: leucine-rich repeat domain-containing protein [Chloroflexi bacterium]|nr:leucine-rich repeat domain-containing protein [Chloroflexota bacterium]